PGVRHGDGTARGLHVTRLCTEELFPVCSPKLLDRRNRLRTPSDLGRFTLLHVSDRQGWRQWLDFAGATGVDPSRGAILNQASMAVDAAGRRPGRPPPPPPGCRMGVDRWSSRSAVRCRDAGVLRVLDRLLEGGREIAEDRGVQRLAFGRGRRRCPPTRETEIEVASGRTRCSVN